MDNSIITLQLPYCIKTFDDRAKTALIIKNKFQIYVFPT